MSFKNTPLHTHTHLSGAARNLARLIVLDDGLGELQRQGGVLDSEDSEQKRR